MELGLSQNQSLKQIQTLSPQMFLSMEILCLNTLDLEARVATELENNETLDRAEPEAAKSTEGGADGLTSDGSTSDGATDTATAEENFDAKLEAWDQYSREEFALGRSTSSYRGEKDEKLEALSNTEGRHESLQEHLEQEIHLFSDEEIRRVFAAFMSGELSTLNASSTLAEAHGLALAEIESLRKGLAPSEEKPATGESAAGESAGGPTPESGGKLLQLGRLANSPADAPVEPAETTATEGGAGSSQADAAVGGANDAEIEAIVANPAELSDAELALVREFCDDVIYNVDSRAYLMYPAPEIKQSIDIEVARGERPSDHAPTMRLLGGALAVVQLLDPPGVGGRDLAECLLLQLSRDPQDYPLEERIIREHLDDLGHNRVPKIARSLSVSVEDVKDAAENIASLDPLPGRIFTTEMPHYVKPDVMVDETEGRYVVRVENEYLPRLQISSHYRNLYRESRKDPEVKKYLKKKIDSAEWLISAIRQRQSTLHRIAQEVVDIQSDFLDHGISRLKPLKMADVAEIVGVHVSTISRAISGKYVQTPRGIFDLKFFFTGGATKSDGNVEARGAVIQRIKDMIAEEDDSSPLSDIAIARKLAESGIKISRRTVTKYREAENIPSSRERRSY